jgi:hypothetical protein
MNKEQKRLLQVRISQGLSKDERKARRLAAQPLSAWFRMGAKYRPRFGGTATGSVSL